MHFVQQVHTAPAVLGSDAHDKLTAAILHCLCSAGLLEGFQNPAEPPWEL